MLKLWILTGLKQSPFPSHVILHFAYPGNLFSVEDPLGEQCSLMLGVSLLALRSVAWTSVQVSAPAAHLLESIALLLRDFHPTNWQWWLLCRDTLGRQFWFLSILVRLCDFFACNVLEISIVWLFPEVVPEAYGQENRRDTAPTIMPGPCFRVEMMSLAITNLSITSGLTFLSPLCNGHLCWVSR